MKKQTLTIANLRVSTGEKEILYGVSLAIKTGEVHAIMGPNGAGKTTLAMSLMGHPGYNIKFQISNFKYQINELNLSQLTPEQRARAGLFVSFQSPVEITGVSVLAFLRTAYKALYSAEKIPLSQFKETVGKALKSVRLPEEFMGRSVNEGFSGGEKKRLEIVQLLVLKPKFAILDEIDSGLDVDSLKIVAASIANAAKENGIGILLITHYQRILKFLKPTHVHILIEGKIKKSGGMNLVQLVEREGYAAV